MSSDGEYACSMSLTRNHIAGERHRESVLQNIAANLDGWTVQTKQETAIYHTLNKLSVDTSRKVYALTEVDC